jgi:hypothetical protein
MFSLTMGCAAAQVGKVPHQGILATRELKNQNAPAMLTSQRTTSSQGKIVELRQRLGRAVRVRVSTIALLIVVAPCLAISAKAIGT